VQEEVLTLDERLLLTAAARGQRSTANGDVEKFYIFPKASASYRLPGFLPRVDELKLRVATGRAGNQPLPFQKFTTATNVNYDGQGGVSSGTVFGDPNIRPEISNEIEGGFDLTAFDSRANLAFTVYQKTVTDLILRPVPARRRRAASPSATSTPASSATGAPRSRSR
jgi:outer membrane receptor protein involved in Fe transport